MASGALTAGNPGRDADGVPDSGDMPMRHRVRLPQVRGLRNLDNMNLIALVMRLVQYRNVGMTRPERMEWERRVTSVYKECLKRFVPQMDRTKWSKDPFRII